MQTKNVNGKNLSVCWIKFKAQREIFYWTPANQRFVTICALEKLTTTAVVRSFDDRCSEI
jgi:hypothetical protein